MISIGAGRALLIMSAIPSVVVIVFSIMATFCYRVGANPLPAGLAGDSFIDFLYPPFLAFSFRFCRNYFRMRGEET